MKWLTKTQDPSVAENDEARQDLARTAWFIGCGLAVGFVLVGIQQVGPRSIAAAWSAAWLAFGAIVGFLFGIPRVLQEPSRIESTSPTDSTSGTSVPAPYRLSVNTNLEQISDWLTKIIVGIGLIELRRLPELLGRLGDFASSGFGPNPAARVFMMASGGYFAALGFLGSYLLTRIYLTGAFSRADRGAVTAPTLDVNKTREIIDKVAQNQLSPQEAAEQIRDTALSDEAELRVMRALMGEEGRRLLIYRKDRFYRPAIERLQAKGYVQEMPYGRLALTEQGKQVLRAWIEKAFINK